MRNRVLVLLVLLVIKVCLNIILASNVADNEFIKLTGNVNKLSQSISKCTVDIGHFYFEIYDFCEFSQNSRISVIGRVNKQLIDIFLGKIFLSDALIDTSNSELILRTKVNDNSSLLGNFREKISSIYTKYLPAREAALVAGIVLGDKKGISGDFNKEMVNSGTIHIAVASGYNVMIVGGTVLTILFWFAKRNLATLIVVIVMLFYALLAGGEPPVMRALLMASLLYFGKAIGRQQATWWALLFTVWFMLMINLDLLRSVSFQLSVAASVGLMIVEPALLKYIDTLNSRLIHIFKNLGITTTVSTMITTAPIIWWHFGRFTFNGLLSNTLVLPLVPFLMLFGVLMIVFGGPVSLPAYLLAHFMVMVIGVFGK